MRWYIIRTLLWKEVLRQLANRGGIVLAALLIVATLLMTFFAKDGGQAGILSGGLETCFVDYWQDDSWVKHLREHVPAELKRQITFRHVDDIATPDGQVTYPAGSGAIQMRAQTVNGRTTTKVWLWDSDSDGSALAPFELWFWRESARYFRAQAAMAQRKNEMLDKGALVSLVTSLADKSGTGPSEVEHERSRLKGGL